MTIQLFVPTFDVEACLSEIRECLEKGWTGLGFKTVEFEQAWCRHTKLPHAHFLNSATSGLHLALNIFKESDGWQDGDEVVTTPLTFVSTNHCILYERLEPVFADVDEYLCIDPEDVLKKITPKTRAVIFVGMGGNSGQLLRVKEICSERGLRLIIDAAHMAGTTIDGVWPSGDATVYSFQAVKNLPTSDSGMICFSDQEYDIMARKKSWLGIDKDTYSRTHGGGTYSWMYDVESVGFKYHGNSIMAAIGIVQLRRLEEDNVQRRLLADVYDLELAKTNKIRRIPVPPNCVNSRHLYQVLVDNREDVINGLRSAGVFPGVHYRDNREYKMYHREVDDCPRATYYNRKLVSLPLHLRLTDVDVAEISRLLQLLV